MVCTIFWFQRMSTTLSDNIQKQSTFYYYYYYHLVSDQLWSYGITHITLITQIIHTNHTFNNMPPISSMYTFTSIGTPFKQPLQGGLYASNIFRDGFRWSSSNYAYTNFFKEIVQWVPNVCLFWVILFSMKNQQQIIQEYVKIIT